jgi:hypothetical protein
MLVDTPPKLRHMVPAAKLRFYRFILYTLTDQGVVDTYRIILQNILFWHYRLLVRAARDVSAGGRQAFRAVTGFFLARPPVQPGSRGD